MDSDNPILARAGAEKAEEILQFYEKLLGSYPYLTLNIVTAQAKMNPVGLEGLIYIDFEEFAQKYVHSDWTWSHELAHHWFGGAVRPKSPEDYCFIVEAPAEYMARTYIRSKTGDDQFFGMLKEFIEKFHLQPAGIEDLKEAAEKAYGKSLTWFFDQWVYGTGIPDYKLEYSITPTEAGEFEIIAHIKQSLWKFRMPIEIIALKEQSSEIFQKFVEHKRSLFRFKVPYKPDDLLLDPEFKVLRWDDRIRVWIYAAKGRKLLANRQYQEGETLLDKSLELNPKSTWAATEKAKRYMINPFFNKPSISVDAKMLKEYTGQYELSHDFIITITQYNGHLYAENAGQQRVDIFAESSDVFFFKAVDAQITFTRDEKGKVTGLIFYDGRKETLARKIK
jgi:uncharacterized protein YneR